MSIRPAPGPPAGLRLVRRHVSGEQQFPRFDAVQSALEDGKLIPVEVLAAAQLINEEHGPVIRISAALSSTEPYPVYTASRKDVGENFLKSARLTAWHYLLVEENDHVHSLVELATLGQRKQVLSYVSLQPRQYAEPIVAAIDVAVALDQAKERNYELRLLRAPDLSLLAVWLHTDQWTDDVVVLTQTFLPDFKAGTVLDESALVKILQPIAERRIKAEDVDEVSPDVKDARPV